MDSEYQFKLETERIGAMPILNHFLARLRSTEILRKHLPVPDPRAKVAPANTLGVLLRSLVLARAPLYSLSEWAEKWVPSLLELDRHQLPLINDDRIGRALDQLFDADRIAILTELVVHMVEEFDISLDQLHNDSTSLTVHGKYEEATGKPMRGKPTAAITFGHNKDFRPDLKQLLWILTITDDGAVPVHFKVADGNTEDSSTHIETWNTLRELVGSANFLYVADSKLCVRGTLKHIDGNGGRFITVMPRTRKEDELFKDWLQQNVPSWEEVLRKPHPRLVDGPPDVIRAVDAPIPDGDGFRVVWYQSSHKMERDAQFRRQAIQSAWKALVELKERAGGPRSRFKSRAAVSKAAEDILRKHQAARWIWFEVTTVKEEVFRQEGQGRPGENTRWRRKVKARYTVSWNIDQEKVDYDARCDGVFPLITNCSKEKLTNGKVLEVYKSKQPMVEKRHDLLKNVENVVPLCLKNIGRVEAFLFLAFVALVVHALLERELRAAMKDGGMNSIPLYPESRDCQAPSARRTLEVFDDLQRHLLKDGRRTVQRFDPELGYLQTRILELLGIEPSAYSNL